jgi:hypothetical protein
MANPGATARRRESLQNKARVIHAVGEGAMVKDALVNLGIAKKTYDSWRYHDKDFVAKLDSARNTSLAYIEGKPKATPNQHGETFDFAQERLYYFGHESPPFHLEMVEAYENNTPGTILMILLPPLHGKTTMFEDYMTLRYAHRPTTRAHVGSESQSLARKVLKRIRNRLDPAPGNRKLDELIEKYGPFAPPKDERAQSGQAWAATHFDIWTRYQEHDDERDYSMAALGFGSQVIGSRSDFLYVDDVQSRKTLNLTEKMFDEFQQDWVSRPADEGVTAIAGNRVDEGDFYEKVDDEWDSDLLKIIRYPAIVPRFDEHGHESLQPLWPGRWTMEKLELRKKMHGDDAWERNWMQRPKAVRTQTFNEPMLQSCYNPLLPYYTVNQGEPIYIGVDPGFGTTAMVAFAVQHGTIRLVAIKEERNLVNNQQILGHLEQMVLDLQLRGGQVTDVVFEENAFQKGLIQDEQLDLMRARYGFSVRGHLTGTNKYDENVGIPSIPYTMNRQEIAIPYAADDNTRFWTNEFVQQCLAWKPHVKGTKLRQDILMAFWFAWILWRDRRGSKPNPNAVWETSHKLQGRPTRGLILPRGYAPSMSGVHR